MSKSAPADAKHHQEQTMQQHFETRNWSATDTGFLQGQGEINEITVTGEVQTLNTGEHPALKEARHEPSTKTLILDLEVPSSGGTVGDVVSWKTISFNKKLQGFPKLHEVEIKGAVEHTVTIKVHSLQG